MRVKLDAVACKNKVLTSHKTFHQKLSRWRGEHTLPTMSFIPEEFTRSTPSSSSGHSSGLESAGSSSPETPPYPPFMPILYPQSLDQYYHYPPTIDTRVLYDSDRKMSMLKRSRAASSPYPAWNDCKTEEDDWSYKKGSWPQENDFRPPFSVDPAETYEALAHHIRVRDLLTKRCLSQLALAIVPEVLLFRLGM